MLRSRLVVWATFVVFGAISSAFAQAPAQTGGARQGGAGGRVTRPSLFFKEEWKQTEKGGEHPVLPDSIANPNLELKMYGPTAKELLLTGAAGDETNPIHVWTGMCTQPCAVALREKNNFGDLSGLARIKWNVKTSGFHQIRPLVKLADGTWLVGDRTDASTRDWLW